MDEQNLLEEIAYLLELEPEEVNAHTQLTQDNWDSLAILGAIALIDEQFNVTIPAKNLKNCKSVGDLLELIKFTISDNGSS